MDPDSDGDSEAEDETLYRALRPEEAPFQYGIHPRAGADETKSPQAHVNSGTNAAAKSAFVSASRSLKTAAAWSVKDRKIGRVAKFKAGPGNVEGEVFHLTTEEGRDSAGLTGAMAINRAKASQEALIKGSVAPDSVQELYTVGQYRSRAAYNAAKSAREEGTEPPETRPLLAAAKEETGVEHEFHSHVATRRESKSKPLLLAIMSPRVDIRNDSIHEPRKPNKEDHENHLNAGPKGNNGRKR